MTKTTRLLLDAFELAVLRRESALLELSVSAIARDLGYSPQFISWRFRRVLPIPLGAWLSQRRLFLGKHMLRSRLDLSIAQVSRMCGFSPAYFRDAFKREFGGLTPQEYRRGSVLI